MVNGREIGLGLSLLSIYSGKGHQGLLVRETAHIADLGYNRQDFWATSSNKQLNFVQHINAILSSTGKAAVVVLDNVLFEGGVGETVRRKLLEVTDLHTILRLPTSISH